MHRGAGNYEDNSNYFRLDFCKKKACVGNAVIHCTLPINLIEKQNLFWMFIKHKDKKR